MRQQETAAVTAHVRRATACQRVSQIDMDIELEGLQTSPVYAPAYIFRTFHMGVHTQPNFCSRLLLGQIVPWVLYHFRRAF